MLAIAPAGLAVVLAGCATPIHLVFHQSTSIGADAATNTETGQVHVSFGYDRQTNTLIPKTTTLNDPGGVEKEAMSVISASEVRIKWLGLHEVTEQFATGVAARNLARDPNAIGQVLSLSVPGTPTTPATPAKP
jgi:hypothetical protein